MRMGRSVLLLVAAFLTILVMGVKSFRQTGTMGLTGWALSVFRVPLAAFQSAIRSTGVPAIWTAALALVATIISTSALSATPRTAPDDLTRAPTTTDPPHETCSRQTLRERGADDADQTAASSSQLLGAG